MLYLDSCVLVAQLVSEPHSSRADAWLAAQAGFEVAISHWVEVEVAAALSAKVRLGQLDEPSLKDAQAAFAALSKSMRMLPAGRLEFERAARSAAFQRAKLRGGDALHVGIAAEAGATLCTLDEQLAEACRTLQLPVELI